MRTTESPLVVYGVNAVLGVLRSGVPVQRLVVGAERRLPEIESEAAARGVVLQRDERRRLDELARSRDHQGAVAVTPPYRYADWDEVVAVDAGPAVVLDGVQDPRNLGAIVRTARAVGVGSVVLPKDRSTGVTGAVASTAAGTLFEMRVCRVGNLARAMEALKRSGFWLVGLTAGAGRSLFSLEPLERPALIVGGEGEGLRPLVRRTCDFEVAIPMARGVESLNVSVAVGIGLYHLVGQRLERA